MEEGSDARAPRRKRVSRACDRCRSKKDKCDGARPTCSSCLASGQTCSYDPHAKKRGLPEGYVRGLEKLWALALCNIDGLEDTALALLGATAESAGRRPRLMQLWTGEATSESLHDAWKTSRLFGALEKMLSHSDADRAQLSAKRSREEGDPSSSGGLWGYRVTRAPTPQGLDAPRVVDPLTSPQAKRARLSSGSDSGRLPLAPAEDHPLRLPPQASQLLEIYFARTHSWFPVIAKHNVLRASYLYASGPFYPGKNAPGSGDHAALWAILSYTVAQLKSMPSEDGETPQETSAHTLSKAKGFYSVARNLIPSEKERFEVGHIQALLLLTLVNVGMEDWTAAWLLSGQAVRMALAMELGTFSNARRSDELKLGKAVFLGCFVVDSILSVRLSRCPGMRPEDVTAVGLLEEDGLEEWNSWVDVLGGRVQGRNPPRRGPLLALSCFNRLVELASVLNKIARDPSSSMGSSDLASPRRILLDLRRWDDRLPLGCRLIGPESVFPERHSTLLPHQTFLCLTFIATLFSLYSRFITHQQSHQRSALEGTKKILFRMLPVLSQYADNFRGFGLPPLFEFPLRSIVEGAFRLRGRLETDAFPFLRWMESLLQRISDVDCNWPVFASLTAAIEHGQLFGDLPEPQASRPFQGSRLDAPVSGASRGTYGALLGDALSMGLTTAGRPHDGARPSQQDGSLMSTDDIESDYTSTILGITIPVDGNYMTPQDSATEITADLPVMDTSLERPADGSSTFLEGMLSQDAPDMTNLVPVTQPHPPTPESSISNPLLHTAAPNLTDASQNTDEGSSHDTSGHGSAEHSPPPNDIDSIFKDLAYLDTNEWASSREEGLKEFGFIDDNTFHEFCNDPDRLVGSQPLVHPPSIADIWPPPGFFPEMFQEDNEEVGERVSHRSSSRSLC
ncbi:hypothetical protein VTN00DRAFT_2440 [Thermoascus crustaceus]|uniref:uncharacterized protein n=1 Tax=Thermoascus crustaceus TaxID=5088 RepID=UPI00374375F2